MNDCLRRITEKKFLDLKSGYPFWLVKNGLMRAYPALDQKLQCEVIVLGGGITGALIAYHLVEAGVDTVVLDKRDVGWGSTSASTALLQYEIDTPLSELTQLVGESHAARAYLACRTPSTNLKPSCNGWTTPAAGRAAKAFTSPAHAGMSAPSKTNLTSGASTASRSSGSMNKT
jgi:monoamine oxidase